MMSRLLEVRYTYHSLLEQQRSRALLIASISLGLIASLGAGVLKAIFGSEGGLVLEVAIALVVTMGAAYVLVQIGRLRLGAALFVLALIVVNFLGNVPFGIENTAMLGFAIPVVAAALLLGGTWSFISAGLCTLSVAALAYLQYMSTWGVTRSEMAAVLTFNAITAGLAIWALAVIGWAFARELTRWALDSERAGRHLEATAAISQITATATSLQVMLDPIIERIRETFGFYHAQVFLIDRGRNTAVLRASTGRAGEVLLARGHMLPVGSRSVIGQCTHFGTPVVVNDVSQSDIHRPNELLPDTHAELAVPMIVGEEIIGALDVQSTQTDAFSPGDVRSLGIIASQLATATEKTRLLDELGAVAEERRFLLEEAQANLRQIEELNRRLTREGWHEYLHIRRERGALGYTLFGDNVEQDSSWTAAMRQAYQGESSVVIAKDQHAHIAAVPIRVRGEVIGVLEIERGGDHVWTNNDLELAEALVERLAMALDNARLFEQAYLVAHREQVLSEITQNVQRAESVDELLQSALAELGRALGASRGLVQISPKREAKEEDDQ